MSANLVNLLTLQFSDATKLLLQQTESRLEGACTPKSATGEGASPCNQVGSIEAEEIESMYAPLVGGNVDVARRWATPQSSFIDRKFDKFTELQTEGAAGVRSTVIQAISAGMRRKRDRVILNAFFASSATGKRMDSTETFTGFTVPVTTGGGGTDVGINVAKFKGAIEMMNTANVDPAEQKFTCMDFNQNAKLLNELEVISGDFNKIGAVIQNGIVTRLLGIDIICTTLASAIVDGNADVRMPFWVKSGMNFTIWSDYYTDITQRKDLTGHPWQVYTDQSVGATRLELGRVVEVLCDPN